MKIIESINSLLGRSKKEPFVSVDIGTSSIKVMELDVNTTPFTVTAAAIAPTPADAISNNTVTKPQEVASVLKALLEENDIQTKKAVFCVPGPAVFTKKTTTAAVSLDQLQSTIIYEASNYIPHKIEAVYFDYQVIGKANSAYEVLLVAVKNEVVQSYVEAIRLAGLDPAIADVDYFALENMFEINYPEESSKTIALIDIGARFSGVTILQNGKSLFTGDVGVGSRLYTDALCEALQMKPSEAEASKRGQFASGYDVASIQETIERTTEHIAAELHRQLGFFWNASGTDLPIEEVFLTGGGAQLAGLAEELGAKTGLQCRMLEPFRALSWRENFDAEYIKEITSSMAVSVGLAARRFGDKHHQIQG